MSSEDRILTAAVHATTTAATSGTSPQAFLQDAVCHLSRLHDTQRASILLLDGNVLRDGASIGLPPDYVAMCDGLEIGPDVGSCGSAAHFGSPQVSADVRTDPRWAAFVDATDAAGLRACFSVPLALSDGTILGTFAVYHDEPYEPDQGELALAASYAGVVALGLDRLRSQATVTASY